MTVPHTTETGEYWYVNAANVNQRAGPYLETDPEALLPTGVRIVPVVRADPSKDFYAATLLDPPNPHKYFRQAGKSWRLVGDPRDAQSYVEETQLYQEFSLREVFQARQQELLTKSWAVRDGGHIMSLGQNDYWLYSDESTVMRRMLFEQDRQRDGWRGDPTASKAPVFLMPQAVNGLWDKITVNESQWIEVMRADAEHYRKTQEEANRLDDELVAAYDDGNGTIAALLAVDIEGAPWPPNPPTT